MTCLLSGQGNSICQERLGRWRCGVGARFIPIVRPAHRFEDAGQLFDERLMTVSYADVGHVGAENIIAGDSFASVIGSQPMLFHLQPSMTWSSDNNEDHHYYVCKQDGRLPCGCNRSCGQSERPVRTCRKGSVSTPEPQYCTPPSTAPVHYLLICKYERGDVRFRHCDVITYLGEVKLERVVGGEGDGQAARQKLRKRVPVVVEKEGIVAQRRHGDSNLAQLWRNNMSQHFVSFETIIIIISYVIKVLEHRDLRKKFKKKKKKCWVLNRDEKTIGFSFAYDNDRIPSSRAIRERCSRPRGNRKSNVERLRLHRSEAGRQRCSCLLTCSTSFISYKSIK